MGANDEDFGIPGGEEDSPQMPPAAPQTAQAPSPPPNASGTMGAPASAPAAAPQVSGRAMFMGNLLKTILSGVQNAPGNPRNGFDRGFMAASPDAMQQKQVQQETAQADLSKAKSEADLAKINVSMTGMKALNYEYMMKRLPQEQQQAHMQSISDFKDKLIKNGANVEAEGDDEKASDAQAAQMNTSDSRATGHAGRFYSLPTMDSEGKPKFDVVYVPGKDTLQEDFKWTDAGGTEHTIPSGTPLHGVMGKVVEDSLKVAQQQTKEQHAALVPPKNEKELDVKLASLKQDKDSNSTFYQHNRDAIDKAIPALTAAKGEMQKEAVRTKPKEAKMGDMGIGTLNGKQVAGTLDELNTAGAKGITKAGAAEAEKVQNARSLTNVFDSNEKDNPGLLQLADKLDKEGKLGPATIRFAQWLNQGNTAANFDAGDPDVQRLFTKMGLATTGLMQVHVGARGSAQMLEHFEELAKAKQMSPTAFKAALDTESRYVKMKAMRPADVKAQADSTSQIDYKPGLVRNGFRFKGGDPKQKANWDRVQ